MMNGYPVCKTKIIWKIEDSNISSVPTLGRLLSIFPYLKDSRIDETFYQEIYSFNIELLTLGGTFQRSFDWEVIIIPTENTKKGTLYLQMETMLEKLGYTRQSAESAKKMFIRKETGSSACLEKVAGSKKVHIHFQPQK